MKPTLLLFGFALSALAGNGTGHAEEARASVYVVDRSAAQAAMGGACLPYTPAEKPGPSREVLAIAKGPVGSTVFMIAFDREAPHLGLAPVVSEQSESSKPARFPAEGSTWTYEKATGPVDLYVGVFDKADPELAKLTEYAEWLSDALKEKNEVDVLLHTEVIQKRLANLLRQRSVTDYRVKFEDSLSSLRLTSSSKAAITRGSTDPIVDPTKREPKASVAAVRRGLKTLDDEWREDSRAIPYGPGTPGILVFPIATPLFP